ncbi:MAG: AAA-like domain-containing protein [Cyanobacteria bacterium SBLK]|nr:AAA-like domain-containing protein [Cyanobacteria bacterium SBLK]
MAQKFRLTNSGFKKVNEKIGNIDDTVISEKCDIHRQTVAKITKKQEPVKDVTIIKLFQGLDLGFPQEGRDYEEYYEQTDANLKSSSQDTILPASDQTIQTEKAIEETNPFYIQRYAKNSNKSLEEQCSKILQQSGALIRIKAPQGMGKKSLIYEIAKRLKQETSYNLVLLNLSQIFEIKTLSNLENFLKNFCFYVSDRLKIQEKRNIKWDNNISSHYNSTRYFQEYLLPTLSNPIVLIMVNFDKLFDSTIVDDFCSLLRSWHEDSHLNNSVWKNLRLVLSYNTESYGAFNINKSRLGNVGIPIELPEFSKQQVYQLVNCYSQSQQLSWNSKIINQWVESLMKLVGGYPKLLRDSLDYISVYSKTTVDEFKSNALRGQEPLGNHLLEHWNILRANPKLYEEFCQVIMKDKLVSLPPESRFKLYGMGLISYDGEKIIPRCQLYQDYFYEQFKNSGGNQ